MKTLERDNPSEERAEVTSETEQPKPTSEETIPTSEEKTRTEEEFRKAQSAWQSNEAAAKAEADEARADAEQSKAQLADIESKYQTARSQLREIEDREAEGDPGSARVLERERAVEAKEGKQAQEKLELDRQTKYAWALQMKAKATEVSTEFGISIQDLEECKSEAEMELKGLKFERTKKKEEPEEKPPKFDSATSSDIGGKRSFSGEEIGEMSYQEWVAAGKPAATQK